MTFETVSQSRCFGGTQYVLSHASGSTGTPMRLAVFLPPAAETRRCPVLWCLSGLGSTEETFAMKAGAQRIAAVLGLILVTPDSSPRGADVPGDPAGQYDLGLGASFYLDATEAPWATHYRMRHYLEQELPALLAAELPMDMSRQGICGHSMGGHGALTLALRNPERFASVSALAPITSPLNCPWGHKALGAYLGADRAAWRTYDACALIEDGCVVPELLVDQGREDKFFATQLKPHLFVDACRNAGIALTYREHQGYDHTYFFVASFIEDHLRWHAERLA